MTGKQKRYLRSLASTMPPVVQIGKNGLENTLALVQQWQEEVKMLYTLLGKKTTEELTSTALILDPVLVNWCHNRGIDSTVFAKR